MILNNFHPATNNGAGKVELYLLSYRDPANFLSGVCAPHDNAHNMFQL